MRLSLTCFYSGFAAEKKRKFGFISKKEEAAPKMKLLPAYHPTWSHGEKKRREYFLINSPENLSFLRKEGGEKFKIKLLLWVCYAPSSRVKKKKRKVGNKVIASLALLCSQARRKFWR